MTRNRWTFAAITAPLLLLSLAYALAPAQDRGGTSRLPEMDRGGDMRPPPFKRYGNFMYRETTLAALVVRNPNEWEFQVDAYHHASTGELRRTRLDRPTSLEIWKAHAATYSPDKPEGMFRFGDLLVANTFDLATANRIDADDQAATLLGLSIDIGGPEPLTIEFRDSNYRREQLLSTWTALTALAPGGQSPQQDK